MSRSFYKYKETVNGNFHGFRIVGNRKMKPYPSIFYKPSYKFWFSQVSFQAKEEMRNANRSLKKKTRQYRLKQIEEGLKEWFLIAK